MQAMRVFFYKLLILNAITQLFCLLRKLVENTGNSNEIPVHTVVKTSWKNVYKLIHYNDFCIMYFFLIIFLFPIFTY